jgi:hypothetical protein
VRILKYLDFPCIWLLIFQIYPAGVNVTDCEKCALDVFVDMHEIKWSTFNIAYNGDEQLSECLGVPIYPFNTSKALDE